MKSVKELRKAFEDAPPREYTRDELLALVKKRNESVIRGYHAMTKADLKKALGL